LSDEFLKIALTIHQSNRQTDNKTDRDKQTETDRQTDNKTDSQDRQSVVPRKLTWHTAGKLAGEFGDEVVTDTVLQWTEDNDRPTVFYYNQSII